MVSDFDESVKSCARACAFGNGLDEALKDWLVIGICNESTQHVLLTVKLLTNAQTAEVATYLEAVATNVVEVSAANPFSS